MHVCVCWKPPGGTRYQEIKMLCYPALLAQQTQQKGNKSVLSFLELSAVHSFHFFPIISNSWYDNHKSQLSNVTHNPLGDFYSKLCYFYLYFLLYFWNVNVWSCFILCPYNTYQKLRKIQCFYFGIHWAAIVRPVYLHTSSFWIWTNLGWATIDDACLIVHLLK